MRFAVVTLDELSMARARYCCFSALVRLRQSSDHLEDFLAKVLYFLAKE